VEKERERVGEIRVYECGYLHGRMAVRGRGCEGGVHWSGFVGWVMTCMIDVGDEARY
jgi:hypothetical protein